MRDAGSQARHKHILYLYFVFVFVFVSSKRATERRHYCTSKQARVHTRTNTHKQSQACTHTFALRERAVFQLWQLASEPGLWRAVYLQFDGLGYETYMATSRDMLHFNLSDPTLIDGQPGCVFSPREGRPPSWDTKPVAGDFDFGGQTFIGPLLENYTVGAIARLARNAAGMRARTRLTGEALRAIMLNARFCCTAACARAARAVLVRIRGVSYFWLRERAGRGWPRALRGRAAMAARDTPRVHGHAAGARRAGVDCARGMIFCVAVDVEF